MLNSKSSCFYYDITRFNMELVMNLEVISFVLGIAQVIMIYYQRQQSAMKLWRSQK